jgi:hypothetical protein
LISDPDDEDDIVHPPRVTAAEVFVLGVSLLWTSDASIRMFLPDAESLVSDVCARIGLVGGEDGSESESERPVRALLPAELGIDADSDMFVSEVTRRVPLASVALESDTARIIFAACNASVPLSEGCVRVPFTALVLSVILSVDGVRMPLGNEDASIMSLLLS